MITRPVATNVWIFVGCDELIVVMMHTGVRITNYGVVKAFDTIVCLQVQTRIHELFDNRWRHEFAKT